jgi:hypothetical protein
VPLFPGDRSVTVCERFQGNSSGDEPTELGSGPDGTNCRYSTLGHHAPVIRPGVGRRGAPLGPVRRIMPQTWGLRNPGGPEERPARIVSDLMRHAGVSVLGVLGVLEVLGVLCDGAVPAHPRPRDSVFWACWLLFAG